MGLSFLHELVTSPVRIVVAVVLLYRLLSYSALIGILAALLLVPIQVIIVSPCLSVMSVRLSVCL